MKQEDRELLLADLCARLPYGVKVQGNFKWGFDGQIMDDMREIVLDIEALEWFMNGIEVRPYLRPMSSMTEEECVELDNIEATIENISKVIPNIPYHIEVVSSKQIDWLNAHHFDHRNLIERGLAIAVTEENDPYKE